MEKFYTKLLKKTFSLSWKSKKLWLFAFFAAFLGQGTVYEFLLRTFSNLREGRTAIDVIAEFANTGVLSMLSLGSLSEIWQADITAIASSLFFLLLIMVILAIILSFAVVGQAGVVDGIIRADQKKKTTIKELFQLGVDKFWQILSLNIITKVVLLSLLLSIAFLTSFLMTNSQFINYIIFIAFFIIFIIGGILIYFLTIFGTAFIVLRHKTVKESLAQSLKLFKNNMLLSLELGVLLFIINIILSTIFVFGMFFILSPFIIIFIISLSAGSAIGTTITSFILGCIFFGGLIVYGSWYNTFNIGVWSLLFEEIAIKGVKARVHLFIDNIQSYFKKRKAGKRG